MARSKDKDGVIDEVVKEVEDAFVEVETLCGNTLYFGKNVINFIEGKASVKAELAAELRSKKLVK